VIGEICQKIKDKRKELGYSLEYTVEKTKLYPSVIKDIEEGMLENINPAYIKGFLRIYAKFLNIDLENSLEEIAQVSFLESKPKKIKSDRNKKFFKVIVKSWGKISPETKRKAVVILLGIILLWSFLSATRFLVSKISLFFKKKPVEKVEQINKPIPSLAIDEEQGISVIVSAKKECYLSVFSDGKVAFKGFLHQGDIETWLGDKEIELKINDGSAIDLEVNGKSIPKLASTPKPIKSLKITSSGISVDK